MMMMCGHALRAFFSARVFTLATGFILATGSAAPYGNIAFAANGGGDEIGNAAEVVNEVTGTAALENDTAQIKAQDKLYQDETILTGENSATQLSFADGTIMTLGPRSDVVLDKFVYNPNTDSGRMVVTVTTGVFRFVSGKLNSEDFQIETPTATMGIRGTQFDVVVEEDGETTVNVNEGEVELSNLAGDVILIPAGYTSAVTPPPMGAPQSAPSALADEPPESFKIRISEMDDLTEGFLGGPNTSFARLLVDLDWAQISGWTAAALFALPLISGGISVLSITGAVASGAIILWMLLG